MVKSITGPCKLLKQKAATKGAPKVVVINTGWINVIRSVPRRIKMLVFKLPRKKEASRMQKMPKTKDIINRSIKSARLNLTSTIR